MLSRLLGHTSANGASIREQRLKSRVYRLEYPASEAPKAVVVKLLDPAAAWRIELVIHRWLPMLGLEDRSARLLGAAPTTGATHVWHVYEDLGDSSITGVPGSDARIGAVLDTIADIHARFMNHPVLGECRHWNGDRGSGFHAAVVRDAARALSALPLELRNRFVRLRERLERLRDAEDCHPESTAEAFGQETLLHGDLWASNIFTEWEGARIRVHLIDWDRAAVGPPWYDLSALLARFDPKDRSAVLKLYRGALAARDISLPPDRVLDRFIMAADHARVAYEITWAALAIVQGGEEWAVAELQGVASWFDLITPNFASGAAD